MIVVAISGSLRTASSNASLLRAVARLAPPEMEIVLYEGIGSLPHFNPDLDGEGEEAPAEVEAFRRLLIDADGIIVCSPEYAHGVAGSFKNAIDWLVSVGELVGIPVVVMNAAPNGGGFAQAAIVETLRVMNWNVLVEASLLTPFLSKKLSPEEALTGGAAVQVRCSLDELAKAIASRRRGAEAR